MSGPGLLLLAFVPVATADIARDRPTPTPLRSPRDTGLAAPAAPPPDVVAPPAFDPTTSILGILVGMGLLYAVDQRGRST